MQLGNPVPHLEEEGSVQLGNPVLHMEESGEEGGWEKEGWGGQGGGAILCSATETCPQFISLQVVCTFVIFFFSIHKRSMRASVTIIL